MKKARILYILNEAEELGGTSLSLENLLHSLGDKIDPLLLLRAKGPVLEHFQAQGYECLVVPFRFNYITGSGWFRNLTLPLRAMKNRSIRRKAVNTVCKLLKDRGVDLVHTNSSVLDLGPLIARKLHVPHVWHIREFIDLGLGIQPIGGYAQWKKQVSSSDAVITISHPLYEHLGLAEAASDWRVDAELESQLPSIRSLHGKTRCYMLPDAVCPVSERTYCPDKQKYFVFLAGRIHPIKNPELAVEAFSRSNLAMKGYKLKLTGRCSENMRWKLSSLAGKYGSPAGVEFHDFTDDVKGLLSHAAGFIICSRHEGLGRVMIESMFYGCPVLAYNSGPAHDIIQDGQNGLLFETAEEAAQLLQRMAQDNMEDMIRVAGDLAVENYSEEKYAGQIAAIYQELLESRQVPQKSGNQVTEEIKEKTDEGNQ